MAGDDGTILWLTGDDYDEELPRLLNDSLAHEIVLCPVQDLAERLEALAGGPPVAAVVDPSIDRPLRCARRLFRLSPLSHIILVADAERLDLLRREIAIAPMMGTHWSVARPIHGEMLEELKRAAKATRQRRHLRTTLGSINVRLRSDRPPRDSEEYRKLVVSDKYLATILEHSHDAIVSLDLRGRVASWNRGATALFGRDEDTSATLGLDDLIASADRQEAVAHFDRARSGEATLHKELQCLRNDDRIVYAEVTLAPVRDDSGEVIAVSLTARDVTERKRAEDQLRRMHAELEERVAQRTADLERVNSELEAFTYSASHDLRAPLRGIDGFSQALLEDYRDSLDATAGSYIERIRAAARRMGDIIDSLLLLSQISQARLRFETVDLGEMARSIVSELRSLEPHRQLELDVEADLLVRADPHLIRIALENLLNNAIKFTSERELAEISVGRVDSRPVPTFYVRDNGAGFDMTYEDKLFLPFQRLHDAGRFEGTGIGLGTVQRVVQRHGGEVWANSAPGQGATFYFELPGADAEGRLADVERMA